MQCFRSFLSSAILIVISLSVGLSTLRAQSPAATRQLTTRTNSKLDLVVASGFNSRPGLHIDLGVRVPLGAKGAAQLTFGTPQWGEHNSADKIRIPQGSLRKVNVWSAGVASLKLKGYTQLGQSGFYGGLGGGIQPYRISTKAKYKAGQSTSLNSDYSGGSIPGSGVVVAIVDAFFGLLGSSDLQFERETRGTVYSLQGEGGYAFAFRDGQRLELGAQVIARQLASKTYAVGTPTGDIQLPLSDAIQGTTWGVEARYVVPLVR